MYLAAINKYLIPLLLLSVFTHTSHSSDFSTWKQQQLSGFKQTRDEFEVYRHEISAAFAEYKRKSESIWGSDTVTPDKTHWVSYIDKLGQRSVVDFENGTIDVEVAIPVLQEDDDYGKKRLEETILKALQQGADKRPMQQIAKQPVSRPTGDPLLKRIC